MSKSILEQTRDARSVRVFDRSSSAGEENLKYFVSCAGLCPSAANLQPLKYRLCYDEDEVAKVFAHTKWAGYLKDIKLPPESKEPTDFIVICHDTDVCPITSYSSMDVGIAAQTINLAAREKGFGTCMIGSFDRDAVCDILSLEGNLVPVLVIAIGSPDEAPVICSVDEAHGIKYFRNEEDVHFVPKRSHKEIIIK